jgi:hypothetical protein
MAERNVYFRAYYKRTRRTRLRLSKYHRDARRWCAWLLAELRKPGAFDDRVVYASELRERLSATRN